MSHHHHDHHGHNHNQSGGHQDHDHEHHHEHGHDHPHGAVHHQSHGHHHEQHQPHAHPHSHHEDTGGEATSRPSEREKLVKMVEHWVHHNEEHVRSYRDWAQRARTLGEEEIGSVLEQIADETQLQTRSFERIQSILKAEPSSD